MRLYVVGTDDRQRQGIYRAMIAPAGDPALLERDGAGSMPADWFEEIDVAGENGGIVKMRRPKNFTIEFVNGCAEHVPSNLAKYMIERKLARATPIIIPAGVSA
ncbi:MAG: hypothetical protein GC190_21870 [Alphaproteobacteria bacterium]|nr:hypothetical protein [Alphaproteobacteria bacterium]